VKNPAKLTVGVVVEVVDFLSGLAETTVGLREQCVASDKAIEADLRACSPPTSVFAAEAEWTGVEKVLELRIHDVRASEALWKDLCPERAQCLLDNVSTPRGPGDYGALCDAYDALIGKACSHTSSACCSMC
jgi:hypothetical protein